MYSVRDVRWRRHPQINYVGRVCTCCGTSIGSGGGSGGDLCRLMVVVVVVVMPLWC